MGNVKNMMLANVIKAGWEMTVQRVMTNLLIL
jgi:hypothetical protein